MILSTLQCTVLAVAMQTGKPYGLAESLPAVALLESSLGLNTIGKAGELGPFQMTVSTAQEVLTVYPWARKGRNTDAEVRIGLLTDLRWAARLAALRLVELRGAYGWTRGHQAYNAGISGMMDGRGSKREAQLKKAMHDVKTLARSCAVPEVK